MYKVIKSVSGFSIAESVAAAAVLGVVTMAFLSVQKTYFRDKMLAKYHDIMNLTINTVENHLLDYKRSRDFLNRRTRLDVSRSSGHRIDFVGVPGNILKVPVNKDIDGNIHDKEIRRARSTSDHFVPNRLYISDMKLFYKRKFEGMEDSSTSDKEEHGFIFLEITFRLSALGMEKTVKRRTAVNVVFNKRNEISRTISPGELVSKVFEDDVCTKKHGQKFVGEYKDGKCVEYKTLASAAIRQKGCDELGGKVVSGKCEYGFFKNKPLALMECPDGIESFDGKGNAVCQGAATPPPPDESKAVALGYAHTCAILNDDSLKCWGDNSYAQLGPTSSAAQESKPQLVGSLKVASMALGTFHTCVILTNGSVNCWGVNKHGQVGAGSALKYNMPQHVNLGSGRRAKTIAARPDYTCVMLDNGELSCWGLAAVTSFSGGQSVHNAASMTGTLHRSPTVMNLGGENVANIFMGYSVRDYICATTVATKSLYCWKGNAPPQQVIFPNGTLLSKSDVSVGSGHVCAVARVTIGREEPFILLKCFVGDVTTMEK